MVVTELKGGLGNQLFQYAAGLSLSQRLETRLLLDCSFLESSRQSADTTYRVYELDKFQVTEPQANEWVLAKFTPHSLWQRALHLLVSGLVKEEKSFAFDTSFFSQKGDIYLRGYWQSERYFQSIESLLRERLSFRNELRHLNKEWADRIKSSHSVSIHIRRGDYVSDPKINSYHGALSIDYYLNGVAEIVSRVPTAHFFVFSDDVPWAKDHLQLGAPCEFITGNSGTQAWEDLKLMSLCQHHIIANSSFSWWGAWLNPSKEKIVVCPREWFADKSIDTSDLIPTAWIRL